MSRRRVVADPYLSRAGIPYLQPQAPGAMQDGWSKTGLLITNGLQRQTGTYTMQADFTSDRGGSGAQYYTMKFGVPNPTRGSQSRAEILWKAQGTDVRRLIDVGNGVSISATAQAARVECFDVSNPLLNPAMLNKTYRVDTLITPGVRPAVEEPPRLTPLYSDWVLNATGAQADAWFSGSGFAMPASGAGSGSVIVPVPQNTGVISFYYEAGARVQATGVNTTLNEPDAFVEPLSALAPPFPTTQRLSSGGFPLSVARGRWIPIAPFVNFIQFYNLTTGGAPEKIIDLGAFCFGIEG